MVSTNASLAPTLPILSVICSLVTDSLDRCPTLCLYLAQCSQNKLHVRYEDCLLCQGRLCREKAERKDSDKLYYCL